MKIFKLLTLAMLLVLGSFSVSALTLDGTQYGFPRFETFGRDAYSINNYGRGGFFASNIKDTNDQAYMSGNLFTRDFSRDYADKVNFNDQVIAGFFNMQTSQGVRGFRNDLTESYGICEPGEQTFNSRTVISKEKYPAQTIDTSQRRGLNRIVIKTSGCDGYRASRSQSDFLVDNFNNQLYDGRVQQLQDQRSFSDVFSEDLTERAIRADAGSSSFAYNQDSFSPFRGTRGVFNQYY